eukprot:364664-Chlamydomonas_euryale.AAC.18
MWRARARGAARDAACMQAGRALRARRLSRKRPRAARRAACALSDGAEWRPTSRFSRFRDRMRGRGRSTARAAAEARSVEGRPAHMLAWGRRTEAEERYARGNAAAGAAAAVAHLPPTACPR